jgi:hypothetical protein
MNTNDNATGLPANEEGPSKTDEFLWWLATAEKELIHDCVVDRNRYRIVGLSVMATCCLPHLPGPIFSARL